MSIRPKLMCAVLAGRLAILGEKRPNLGSLPQIWPVFPRFGQGSAQNGLYTHYTPYILYTLWPARKGLLLRRRSSDNRTCPNRKNIDIYHRSFLIIPTSNHFCFIGFLRHYSYTPYIRLYSPIFAYTTYMTSMPYIP